MCGQQNHHPRLRLGIVLVAIAIVSFIDLSSPVIGEEISRASPFQLVIRGGWVFDTPSGTFVPNRGLGIAGERLETLDVSDSIENEQRIRQDTRLLELKESHYILPGWIDCHAHYNVKLFKRRREEFEVMPVVYLANGTTVTFSCGEFAPDSMEELRKRIESGQQIGPRLINSGPYFGRARPGWRRDMPEDEIRAEVDYWAGRGVGGFKAKQIAPNELKVLIEQAHRHGLTVTGHLDSGFRNSVNPIDAIDMGIDRIEHFLGGEAMPGTRSAYESLGGITADMPEYQAIVRKYIEHGTVFDATLTAYGYFGYSGEEFDHWYDERSLFTPFVQQSVRERGPEKPDQQFVQIYLAKLATIKAYHAAGGIITLGTDHVSNGNYLPGFSVHRELDAFVRGGISPADAIRIGTINGAKALRVDRDHGSLEQGKIADLIVVEGNPLANIRNTRNVRWVATRGQLHASEALLEQVRGKLGPASESEQGDW